MPEIFRIMTAAGASFKFRELVSPTNKVPVHKPLGPFGPSRLMHPSLKALDAIEPTHGYSVRHEIYVTVPTFNNIVDTSIRSHLEEIKGFFNSKFECIGQGLVGTAGSLVELAFKLNIPDDAVVVKVSADNPCNMFLQPAIASHISRQADATIVLKEIGKDSAEYLGNYDTATLKGMPVRDGSISDEDYAVSLSQFIASLGQERTAQVNRYFRRHPWKGAPSTLADTSMAIFSGHFLNHYIKPQITRRPSPENESRLLAKIDKMREVERGIIENNPENVSLLTMLNDEITRLSEQSIKDYHMSFYNTEHVMGRATREGDSQFMKSLSVIMESRSPDVTKFLASREKTGGPLINAYIMPESCFWIDVDSPEKLLEVNMKIIKTKDINVLELERGMHSELWMNKYYYDTPGNIIGTCWYGKNVVIDNTVQVRGVAIIGDKCKVGSNVFLQDAIIGPGNILEKDVSVIDSVLFPQHESQKNRNLILAGKKVLRSLFVGGTLPVDLTDSVFYPPSHGGIIRPLV